MQRGPKNINLQRGGLDTEGVYTSEAHNRQKLHKQSPDTLNLHKQGPHTDRTYTNRAKTPSEFK